MKTDQLINLLSEDAPVRLSLNKRLLAAIAIGVVISGLVLLATIGIRHDISDAIQHVRVIFKIATTLAIAVTAVNLVSRIGKPGVSLSAHYKLLLLPLALLASGVLLELVVTPQTLWMPSLVGRYSRYCILFVPMLSLAPLGATIWALRHGAPEDPALAGAVAGLTAGGIGASIYAWHCPDDSPLFVACWYMLSIIAMTSVGYLAGKRVLRW